MAEIKIEKKKTVWPWVLLGILILALLIYFFGFRNEDNKEVTQTDPSAQVISPEEGGPVSEYIQYVNSSGTMALNHEYTSEALLKLTNAVKSKGEQVGQDVSGDLDKVNEYADKITRDPFETTHANSIRKSADILADAMQNIQAAKYPNLSAQCMEVKNAANNIDPDVLTLDQKDAVKSFFEKSANLLEDMN